MLDLLHSILIHDIDDLGLVRMLLRVLQDGDKRQYESEQEE